MGIMHNSNLVYLSQSAMDDVLSQGIKAFVK